MVSAGRALALAASQSGGSTTDESGRTGRDRPARFVWRVYVGTWEGEGSRASISEPETALPLTNGKQGAGSAQRRPGCRASSWTSAPDTHNLALCGGRGKEKLRASLWLWSSSRDIPTDRIRRLFGFVELARAAG